MINFFLNFPISALNLNLELKHFVDFFRYTLVATEDQRSCSRAILGILNKKFTRFFSYLVVNKFILVTPKP